MKKFFLIITLCIVTEAISAQNAGRGRIKGIIVAKSSESPIEYATVTIQKSAGTQVLSVATTDSLGRFQFDKMAPADYTITCSYIGCNTFTTNPFKLEKTNADIDFGKIILDDSALKLNEIIVQGEHSTYIQTIDKKIFNVGADLMSSSGTISDLMQNIPSVQVDIEGNVSLRGNENVQILINGKPSSMMKGANRGTFLQQLPANSVERVEVITNPSAQFKPDGTSGIINLILKKERKAGFSGTVLGNIGNKKRYNGALSLGYNSSNFNITGNYGIRLDNRDRFTYDTRTLMNEATGEKSYITQNTTSHAPSTAHIAGLNLGWNINDKNSIEIGGNFTYMTFPRTEDNHMLQRNDINTITDYTRSRYDNEVQKQAEGSAAFIHTFAENHTFTIDYTFAMEDEVEDNNYTNYFLLPVQQPTKDNTLIKQKVYENLVRAIYENELKNDNKLVIGYELEADKSNLSYYAEDFINGVWVKNTTKSNNFIFNEQVHSLYTTYEQTFGQFGFLAGVRGEQSYIKSQLLTLDQTVSNQYFMFYPTMHLSYKLNDYNELQANYSLRVNRPEGDDLNPFPEYQDPYNLRKGNPYLMPEKIHSIEAGYQWKKRETTLIATLFYRYTYNQMTEITKVTEGDILVTTKENISSGRNAGLELIANSAIGKTFLFNINSNIFYNQIDASALGYGKNRTALAWFVALNTSINLFRNAMVQINARYNSSTLTPQGKRDATFITNLGAKYEFRKQNISVMATVSDLFNTYKTVNVIDTPTLQQRIERSRNPHIFYIGLSYNFGRNGKKQKPTELKYDTGM